MLLGLMLSIFIGQCLPSQPAQAATLPQVKDQVLIQVQQRQSQLATESGSLENEGEPKTASAQPEIFSSDVQPISSPVANSQSQIAVLWRGWRGRIAVESINGVVYLRLR